MIPYFELPSLPLGPFNLEPFGIFVVIGVWTASSVAAKVAKREGKAAQPLLDFAFWALLAGVAGGHWLHLFAYHPEELHKYGAIQILKLWDGLSSTGGLLGGIAAALVFFKRKGLRFEDYGDALALGVAIGWGIARVSCFVTHDHPGVHTDFFLAVRFPDGPRHDLGLYDALLLFSLGALIAFCRTRRWFLGKHLALLAALYGTSRFGLDFLRAKAPDVPYADGRYLGLTPAQYVCVLLVLWGVFKLAQKRKKPES